MAPPALARMRVRAARTVPRAASPGELSAGALVECAVGQFLEVDEADEAADRGERAVWIQGGTSLPLARLEWDDTAKYFWITVLASSVCCIPSSLPDAVALLANDMAAAIHAAKIASARQLATVAVVATSTKRKAARLLKWYLQQASDPSQTRHVQVVMLDGVQTNGVFPSDALLLDCCIDLCCSEASLDFATRQLEPLGTLILTAFDAQATDSTLIDMNTVVVNELKLAIVGEFQHERSEAIELLAAHVASGGVEQLHEEAKGETV